MDGFAKGLKLQAFHLFDALKICGYVVEKQGEKSWAEFELRAWGAS